MKTSIKADRIKRRAISVVTSLALLVVLSGCEAFTRKFTRQTGKERPAEEMVLIPQEYPSLFEDKEAAYRQYFSYWRAWQDELINALTGRLGNKKAISCIEQAIRNLEEIREMLLSDKQAQLDLYIGESRQLKDNLTRAVGLSSVERNRHSAERLKRNILRDFSYPKIEAYLK